MTNVKYDKHFTFLYDDVSVSRPATLKKAKINIKRGEISFTATTEAKDDGKIFSIFEDIFK